jgi:hypothetical protein
MADTTKTQTKVESAPPAKSKLTDEQRAELREKIRARMSRSKLETQAPEGWTAYWARKEDQAELARLDFLGFRVVREQKEAVEDSSLRRYKAQGIRSDGTYVMGDVILMEIPSDDYEIIMEENSHRSSNMAEAAKQHFRDEAEKKGAPTFVVKRGT